LTIIEITRCCAVVIIKILAVDKLSAVFWCLKEEEEEEK